MKNKILSLVTALVLCMSAVAFPTVAYAAGNNDTTPPKLTATLDGGTLTMEASDDMSGVEAVYIDNNRVNTLVNGKGSVALKDYAGTSKQVCVYAVDYAGNRSDSVKFDNPYYEEPAQTSAPAETAPASQPAQSTQTAKPAAASVPSSTSTVTQPASTSAAQTSSASDSSNAASTSIGDSTSSENEETESAVPEGAFTPDGTGTVMDQVSEQEDDKQFYTITTAAGNVFYLIVDGKRDDNNVYFLNAVTESDLMALAETDSANESAVPEVASCICTDKCETGKVNANCPVCKYDLTCCAGKETQPAEAEEPVQAEPEQTGSNVGLIVFIVLAAVAAGGAGYYFKIVRPKQQAALEDDEDDNFMDDEYGEGFDSDSEYGDGSFDLDEEETMEDGE